MMSQELFGQFTRLRPGFVMQAVAAAFITTSIGVDATHGANSTTLVAALRAGQEVPTNASTGRGCGRFEIDVNTNTMRYYIAFGGLSGPETAAHIHGPAGPGVNAGVVFPLPAGNPKVGTWTYPAALEADLLAGRMYVNIHTALNPGGEIRGQINSFAMNMDGPQENPAVTLLSQGWGTFHINTCNNSFDFYIVIESLSGAETAAHIHGMALPSVNAAVLFPLPAGSPKVGTWNYPESQESAILAGLTYANVHTGAFPGGEIRGQIVNIVAPMDAAQEVPPVPNPAGFGCALCAIDSPTSTLGYYITFAGLSAVETAAHFHGWAPAGVNAGVIMPLALGTPKKGIWAYGAANSNNIMNDLSYVNVHTTLFPGGEIRGQIVVPLPRCVADTNCDGNVDVSDLLIVINAWGPCSPAPAPCPADTNYDGTVNVNDLLSVINSWGKCP